MKKPSKTTITHKLDRVVSEIVRARGYCVKCRRNNDTLQAAHIFSRSNRAVRWDLMNILCLCAGCHFWVHKNPTLFTEYLRENWMGEEKYCELRRRATMIKKWRLDELQDLYEEFVKIKEGQWK